MNRYILFPHRARLTASSPSLATAVMLSGKGERFALTALRIERNDMYMHFWRTKGTLPGIIANVKAASPQENRALQRSSALFYPVLGQQNPLNYFIYLINCSAFVRICALDRAVRS